VKQAHDGERGRDQGSSGRLTGVLGFGRGIRSINQGWARSSVSIFNTRAHVNTVILDVFPNVALAFHGGVFFYRGQ
jgi:hypothetical protein